MIESNKEKREMQKSTGKFDISVLFPQRHKRDVWHIMLKASQAARVQNHQRYRCYLFTLRS